MSFIQTMQNSQCVKSVVIEITKCYKKFIHQDKLNLYTNISFVKIE